MTAQILQLHVKNETNSTGKHMIPSANVGSTFTLDGAPVWFYKGQALAIGKITPAKLNALLNEAIIKMGDEDGK